MVGQVLGRIVVERDHVAEVDRRPLDLLVLAELTVGNLQIGKIDSAKRLGFPDGLRILHRGGEQVVHVDAVKVEDLEDMGAALAQELRDRGLIAIGIELGLHCVGGCRHLAQRQGRGENLDENRIHLRAQIFPITGLWTTIVTNS